MINWWNKRDIKRAHDKLVRQQDQEKLKRELDTIKELKKLDWAHYDPNSYYAKKGKQAVFIGRRPDEDVIAVCISEVSLCIDFVDLDDGYEIFNTVFLEYEAGIELDRFYKSLNKKQKTLRLQSEQAEKNKKRAYNFLQLKKFLKD